ncbi:SRPBCC family protein [Sphingosinicella rhizophila]|uniref:SRPBCC family protein n=1 Tax=Sphingosinicella rhizophila TaxID=3050082 RepID=A0ABU3Q6Y2_9SPHN|nr:SRPBCC family protein [Sphingosinicella sp. GR2756]MDT9599145.1 SRPBCC family protein [Sphingosinicella sp. GR2756]
MHFSLPDLFPRGLHVERAARLASPADLVWATVGNLADGTIGEGLIERVEVTGEGAGAIRRFHLPGGLSLTERIEHHDPAERCYVYRMIDHGPLPFTRYLGCAQVLAAGPDAAVISWLAMAQPIDGEAEAAQATIEANLDHVMAALKRRFGG